MATTPPPPFVTYAHCPALTVVTPRIALTPCAILTLVSPLATPWAYLSLVSRSAKVDARLSLGNGDMNMDKERQGMARKDEQSILRLNYRDI